MTCMGGSGCGWPEDDGRHHVEECGAVDVFAPRAYAAEEQKPPESPQAELRRAIRSLLYQIGLLILALAALAAAIWLL